MSVTTVTASPPLAEKQKRVVCVVISHSATTIAEIDLTHTQYLICLKSSGDSGDSRHFPEVEPSPLHPLNGGDRVVTVGDMVVTVVTAKGR